MSGDLDRGGFQNLDVGRSQFRDDDYGPDYGIDFAHFSDPVKSFRDLGSEGLLRDDDRILRHFEHYLELDQTHAFEQVQCRVKNRFVILEGTVPRLDFKMDLEKWMKQIPEVYNVINLLKLNP